MKRTLLRRLSGIHAQHSVGILHLLLLLLLASAPTALSGSGEPHFLGVLKGRHWLQTNAGPAVADGGSNHAFRAFIDLGPDGPPHQQLYLPSGGEVPLPPGGDGSDREVHHEFSSSGALDTAFPNGVYTIVVSSVLTGTVSNQLSLTGDLYPGTPTLVNYGAVQSVDPAASFLLTWDSIAGATTNDFIQVQLTDCNGARVLETAPPGMPGYLNGTATSISIPARRLRPGRKYELEIMAVRFSDTETNSLPGTTGVAGYFSRTRSWLTTIGTPTDCGPGQFELMFQFPFYELTSTQGVVSFPQNLAFYVANFSLDGRSGTNFPPNVRFTGPGGFGWTNETNFSGTVDPYFAWYGSRFVNVPPFPPGGIYTVNFQGTNQLFNLLDPNAAQHQVLLVPTAIVDPSGLLTEIRWGYFATNGAEVGPQPFMEEVVVSVEVQGGRIYDPMNHGIRLLPTEAAHAIPELIPWDAVLRLQLGFRDPAGNRFVSHWDRPQTGPLQILTSQLLPGRAGQPYEFILAARGGMPPRRWTLDSGFLPASVELDPDTGILSGTPANPGVYPITIRVTDGQSNSVAREFALSIESGGGPEIGSEPNLRELLLVKGVEFLQTNSSGATPATASNSIFRASVAFAGPTSVTNGALHLPGGALLPFAREGGGSVEDREAALEKRFASTSALDLAFPNGTYDFLLETANAGRLTNSLTLTGNVYPATPRINNFAAAQSVNPTNEFILSWDALAGATTNDLIMVEIRDCLDRDVFSTPGPGESRALLGTATGVVIPARTLRPGQGYSVQLIVARIITMGPTVPPGGRKLAGYYKQLRTSLTTLGTAEGCAEGDLRLVFTFRPGAFNGLTAAANYPEDFAYYTAQYSIPRPPNLPQTVRFSGPPGSGLNNTEHASSAVDDQRAWYNSVNVNTPPYPPGGTYTVHLDTEPRSHTFLDPNAAAQKVLLVPNVVTNDAGQVTAVSWTYRNANGDVIAPPQFLRQLRVRLLGANGWLFGDGGSGPELHAPATNQVVDPPVPWSDVTAVQTGFQDPAGHEFLADWLRLSSEVRITTFALPGAVISNAYQGTLTAFGGTPPYRWTVQAGNLPAGLTLNPDNGQITGTPLEIGLSEFLIRVNDNSEHQAERGFVIGVRPPRPDASTYVVAKGRRYQQTNATPAAPATPGYRFVSFVESGTPGGVQDANLELPSGLVRTLTNEFDRFALEESFPTQLDLDSAFANGVYKFTITTVHDGTPTPALLLTNNLYPPAPRVANWPAAQAIDAAHSFGLAWDAFPGGTTNDLIVLGISNESGEEIFGTPGFLELNHLDGTRTNALIPGGTLIPGATHRARLLFVRRTALDLNTYPPVPGIAAYFAETEFPLGTLNPAGAIQFAAPLFSVDEDAGTFRVPVVRRGGTDGNVAVHFAIAGGSAGSESDYTLAEGALEFPDGVATNYIMIELNNDDLPEPPETIELTLLDAEGGAGLGLARTTVVTILDDDRRPGANVEFYVVAKGQSFQQTGPGIPGADDQMPFFFGAFTRAAFRGGLTSAAVVSPAGVTNNLPGDEGSGRHFELFSEFDTKTALDSVYNRGVYTFLLNTVTDGARTPAMTLAADAYPNAPKLSAWGAAQAINAFADFTLSWDTMIGGGADDFVRIQIKDTNTFDTVFESPDLLEDGALNGTATSVVIPGGLLEPGRSYACELLFFNVTVINTLGYPGAKGLGGYARQTRTMISTVTPPPPGGQIQFGDATFRVSETNETATISLMRVGGSEGEASVVVSATNGTATAGADFTATSTVVTFANGETNATFTFPILDDSTFEGPETVRLAIRSVTGAATLAGQTNALAIIVDNELPPTPGSLQFAVTSVNAPESVGTVTLTVTRVGGSAGEVTVDYATEDGSALAGEDYAGDAGTLVLGPGVTSRAVTLEIVPDALDESNEVFTVTLSNPSNGATLGERQTATVTITDDDVAGVIAFGAPEYRVGENGGEAVITVRRTGGTAEGVMVDYAATPDTAFEDVDFEATMGTLAFDAGVSEATFVVPILDDEAPEGNEVLRLALSNPSGGATLGRITNASLTILDDEVVVQFARVTYTNSEAGPLAILTVVRTGPLTDPVAVDYMTDDETAFAGEDYTESTGTIAFAAGASSKTFSVPILNDGLVEDDETFTVTLFNPEGAQLGDAATATVQIVDNDEGGTVGFTTTTINARENSPFALLTVTRSGGRASGVTVDFTVIEGTATDGEDYVSTNGTLTFAEGVTRLTIAVPIIDDALDEEGESFTVQLSNATGGAVLGENDEATVNIADNDVAGTVRFAATTFSASETGTVATITVLRSGGKAGGVTIDYATEDGTAVEGNNYTETSGTLTFDANETSKTFEVPVLNDEVLEGNKTVLLRLSNPGGGARLLAPTNATLNIIDSAASVQFASATYTVNESGRSVLLTVVRSGPPGTVAVTYSTANGTATSPADYKVKTGVITFNGTTASRTVAIPILNDTTPEEAETFTVTLSNPTGGAQLGGRDTATVTIVDNDVAPRARRR